MRIFAAYSPRQAGRPDPRRLRPVAGRDHRDGRPGHRRRLRRSPSAATSRRRRTSPPWPRANDYLLNNNSAQAIDARPDGRRVEQLHERRRRRPSSTSTSTRATASRSRSTISRAHRTRSSAPLGDGDLEGHDDGDRPRRLPGQRHRGRPVHLPDQRVRRRRHAEVPDADRLRRRRTATSRPASWTSPGRTTGPATSTRATCATSSRASRRSTRRSPTASTSASTTTATTPTLYGDVDTYLSRPGHAGRRSSTPAATSWAGRRSTSTAPTAGSQAHQRLLPELVRRAPG